MYSINRTYYEIEGSIKRNGCASKLVASCQVSIPPSQTKRRTELTHKVVTTRLVHATKENKIKNTLSLESIHKELEAHSLMLQQSGSSNVLLSKVSFDCLIERKLRDYVSFDLRIPGANTNEDPVFCYDLLENMYGGKKNLYDTLKYFYELGRSYVNPQNYKHGHIPSYNSLSPKHDQYIRHTEQLLAAYLHLPTGANMLCNRLRSEIRAKYSNASHVKVYNMTLHMHSTKTCCAPCEYSLIGMMNNRTHHYKNELKIGLIPNFIQACSIPNERLNFTFPQRSSFQVLTTVTASFPDADHRKQPKYIEKTSGIYYDILVKDPISTKHIFTTMLDSGYSRLRFPNSPNLSDKTVSISGSNSSSGSPKTKDQVKNLRDFELSDLCDVVKNLFTS